ncbi:MAG: flagellar motor protein [Rhodocyclaceae bacterium]|nr:flagellar motor protein [Rhodocyclaceae bacterium]
MDKISLIGLIVGISAILVGQILEGGHIASLLQPTAFFIVIGGTLGAVMLQSPWATFAAGVKMGKWVFFPPRLDGEALIERIVDWSHIARKEGLLALEAQVELLADPFMKKGLQLLVDGAEPERIREVLEVELSAQEEQMKLAAKIWESAGGYAPTIGILGAVMGLIHVMENLSEPSKLGAGIAVAFVATIYGVGSANLIFLPIAKKLLAHIGRYSRLREMYIDGLIGIANGDNPRIIESRLQGYLG